MQPSPPSVQVVAVNGVEHKVLTQCLSDYYWQRAIEQDAIPQPPYLEDPEAVLQDESGFNAWRQGKQGLFINLFECWFRERTGILVCAAWPDGFAYRPRHKRDPKGVWHSWGKHANWFKKLILSEGDYNGQGKEECGRQGSDAVADSHGDEHEGHRTD